MTKPHDWDRLLSTKRFGPEPSNSAAIPDRSPFEIDYDRIVFSRAFRRMGRKTQVHPLAENDHVHNRLTHSIEVASLGRSLGLKAGGWLVAENHITESQKTDLATITQAACLAHDIGNPPFGHAGEFAIRDWFGKNKDQLNTTQGVETFDKKEFQDFLLFEGNAQAFRLTTALEGYGYDGKPGGMRLTYATLATLIKYPWDSSDTRAETKQKHNAHQTEIEDLSLIFTELGLTHPDTSSFIRHPLSYLMEAADDIAYGVMDIEDAVEMGSISTNQAIKLLAPLTQKPDYCSSLPSTRARAITHLISHATEAFTSRYQDIKDGTFEGGLTDNLNDAGLTASLAEVKTLSRELIYTHRRKVELEIAAHNILGNILTHTTRAVDDVLLGPSVKQPFYSKQVLTLINLEAGDVLKQSRYQSYMQILDYISGMTDDYATRLSRQILSGAIA